MQGQVRQEEALQHVWPVQLHGRVPAGVQEGATKASSKPASKPASKAAPQPAALAASQVS